MDIITTKLPTKRGNFNFSVMKSQDRQSVFLTTKDFNPYKEVFVRIHSECMTGDLFHSLKCDCGEQLDKSLKILNKSKNGVLIYLRQEGRGIGLFNKIKTYNIQENGIDTHQANIEINRNPDEREYSEAIKILEFLKIKKINLITNNPDKVKAIEKSNILLNKVISLRVKPNEFNRFYMQSKKNKFKHYFDKKDLITYIGISGVSKENEISEIYKNINAPKNKNIFLGINTSEKELLKIIPLFSHPSKKGFKKILHFSFNKKSSGKIVKQIIKIKGLEGIQLNDLENGREIFNTIKLLPKRLEIILPLCKENLEILKNEEFIKRLKRRKIYFLIDNSKGKGVRSNFSEYLKYILFLLNKGQNKIAVSGGISPENYKIIFDLEEYFKFGFSVDAESKLKTNGKLDINKIKKYVNLLK